MSCALPWLGCGWRLNSLPGDERPELHERLSHDIAELDELIGEILLASRLDTMDTLDRLQRSDTVDLLALLAEEGARTGADVSGESVSIQGDPRMLRRLMRNSVGKCAALCKAGATH